MDLNKIVREIEKDEKLLNAYDKQLRNSARAYRRSVIRSVNNAMENLVTDDQGRIHTGMQNQNVLDEIEKVGVDAVTDDMREVVEEANQIFQKRMKTLDRMAKNLGIEEAMLGDNLEEIPFFKNKVESVSDRLSEGSSQIAEEIERSIARVKRTLQGGDQVTKQNVVDTIRTQAGKPANYAYTIANTELMAIDRGARVIQGEKAGIDQYWYTGPGPDQIIRDFCADHLDRVESVGYWNNISNDTGPNPVTEYGGGYNCRHRLVMWRDEWS